MNKTGLFLSIVVVLTAFFTVYAYAKDTCTEETARINEATYSAAVPAKEKVLVAYFTSPETDDVDASSGASRLIADGKLYGNTEYVATLISQKTGGDLFRIKTEHTYPGTHKGLIEAAKKRNRRECPSETVDSHPKSTGLRCDIHRLP